MTETDNHRTFLVMNHQVLKPTPRVNHGISREPGCMTDKSTIVDLVKRIQQISQRVKELIAKNKK